MPKLRNTPDRNTKLSPAKAPYRRELLDFLPFLKELWMNVVDARELPLGHRTMKAEKQWSKHTRPLLPLKVGDDVIAQKQSWNHPLI